MSDGLTLEKLQEAIDLVYPPLYYGLDKHIERGVLYLCKETDFNPEYIVCHPDDFEAVKSKITARRLVHIKDEPKEKVIERMLRHLTPLALDEGDSAHLPALGGSPKEKYVKVVSS